MKPPVSVRCDSLQHTRGAGTVPATATLKYSDRSDSPRRERDVRVKGGGL